MKLPKRKQLRLPEYNYSQNGVYFLTICTQSRKRVLAEIVGRAESSRPTQLLPRVIAALKRFSNRDMGEKLWQSGYYEHIIRDENDFLVRWQYIDQNPAKWAEDEYYGEGGPIWKN